MRSRAGFTLIELTLVVLLLAILTAVGAPKFRQLYEYSEMQKVTSDVAGALRYAQQRALMERVPIHLVIDVEKQAFWVPIEQKPEQRHYASRHHRRKPSRQTSRRRGRVREVKEIRSALPEGFIFEFVYKVADDQEIRRREGEIVMYPDGSADETFITILRLANKKDDERRIFIKIDSATGRIASMEGIEERDGTDFYRGFYDET